MRWRKERMNARKGKGQKNEMEKRKEEYKERTRIKRMRWKQERKNTRKGQG